MYGFIFVINVLISCMQYVKCFFRNLHHAKANRKWICVCGRHMKPDKFKYSCYWNCFRKHKISKFFCFALLMNFELRIINISMKFYNGSSIIYIQIVLRTVKNENDFFLLTCKFSPITRANVLIFTFAVDLCYRPENAQNN